MGVFFNTLLSLWFHHTSFVQIYCEEHIRVVVLIFFVCLDFVLKRSRHASDVVQRKFLFCAICFAIPPIETFARAFVLRLVFLYLIWLACMHFKTPGEGLRLLLEFFCHFLSNSWNFRFQVQRHRSVLISFHSPPEVTQTCIEFCKRRWRNSSSQQVFVKRGLLVLFKCKFLHKLLKHLSSHLHFLRAVCSTKINEHLLRDFLGNVTSETGFPPTWPTKGNFVFMVFVCIFKTFD